MSDNPVYLTADGLEKLKTELHLLKTEKRPAVTDRIEKARELGDLRENADYHDARDEAAWIEGRISELTEKIRLAVVVGDDKNIDQISIGSTVRLSAEDRPEKTFTIVGATEADPLKGRISNESPLGRVLIGRKLHEKVEMSLPSGIIIYTVEEIS